MTAEEKKESLVQLVMIERVRALALTDDDLSAVLMYGSFIKGEGDRYSDIEFYLFHRREIDHRLWVERIRPVEIFFKNEFGTEVAIFDNLIRGEFHFAPIDEIEVVKSWEGLTSFEYAEQMALVDKDGRLAEVLAGLDRRRPRHDQAEQIAWLAESLLNNLLMVKNTLERGELAHAHQAFSFIQKYLLWLIRLADRADNHWENPSKKLEKEISGSWYQAYAGCAPALERESLRRSLKASLALAEKLFTLLKAPEKCLKVLDAITDL